MNVVDDRLASTREQQPDRDQFGVMEVVQVGILAQCLAVYSPHAERHPLQPPRCGWYGLDLDTVLDFVASMRCDQCNLVPGTRQRLALLVEDANIEGRMDRC